jgi:6-phosphogluconolactonase
VPEAPSRLVYIGTYTAPNTAPGGARPGEARGIAVFRMDGRTGALEPVQVVEGVENPSWLALDPAGERLYAVSEVATWRGRDGSGGLVAYAVDPAAGTLARLGDQPTLGAAPAHVSVDPGGRHVLVANYAGACFTVLPVTPAGVGPATDVFRVSGSGPDPARQEAPHPHAIELDPRGGVAHGPDLGTDRIWAWRLDAAAGRLVPTAAACVRVAAGSGPRHLAFHPGGRFAYVVHELSSEVSAFAYDPADGVLTWLQALSALPPGASAGGGAEIVVHPGGRFVYASNRGPDGIAAFAVDEASGRLAPAGWTPSGGRVPRGMALDPDGRLLLAANQNSDAIVPFEVDPDTGRLRPTGHVTRTPTPVCVRFGRAVTG